MKMKSTWLLGAAVCAGLVLLCSVAFAQPKEECAIAHKPGKGFTWESPDKKYSLQLCGRIKWGWTGTDLDKDRGLANTSGFGFGLAYLFVKGKLYGEDVTYTINYRLEKATSPLDDLIVTWKPKQAKGYASAWCGRFKTNFSREYLVSSGVMQLPGKSIANGYFNMGRDHGIVVKTNMKKDLVSLQLGVFDGGGGTGDRVYSKVIRVEFNPFGPVKYQQSDLEMSEKPLLSIGIGYGVDPNINDYDADGKLDDDDIKTVVELAFFFKGLNINISLYKMTETEALNPGTPQEDDRKSNGYSVTGGFFVIAKKVEIVGILSFYDPDEEASHNWMYEGRIGFNVYFNGQNLKLQFDTGTIQQRLAQGKYIDLQTRVLLQAHF